MKQKYFSTFALMLILIIAGCAKPYDVDISGDGTYNNYGDGSTVYGEDGYTVPGSNSAYSNTNGQAAVGDFYEDPSYGVNVIGGPAAAAKDRVIYFSYDSSQLDSRSIPVLQKHAEYLRNHPKTRVVLEGHTDERGTREYNIGLGERRAYAVRGLFVSEGVEPAQIRVLSYGEERPADNCSSEQCYSKNRRAVIIY